MRSFFVLVLAIVCFLGCGARPRVPAHAVPQVRMTVHADTAFTPHERALIMTGVDRMHDQTGGFVDFAVDFDLDFDSMDSLKLHAQDNTLTRTPSTAQGVDKDTLGFCIVYYEDLNFVRPTKAALIYDRLKSDEVWIHVAMHEMLHMLRLHHVDAPKTVMFKSTQVSGKAVVTCMTPTDMEELCATHGCDLKDMRPCNP